MILRCMIPYVQRSADSGGASKEAPQTRNHQQIPVILCADSRLIPSDSPQRFHDSPAATCAAAAVILDASSAPEGGITRWAHAGAR
jgi:hypothetical protein